MDVIAAAIFFCGLLRIRSFNALEPRLREAPFTRLVGGTGSLCSVDTVSRTLRKTELHTARNVAVSIVQKAERNKVFREGWHGALRYAAVDGWEPICSRNRHCQHCLTRNVEVKTASGKKKKVVEYYHRYAVVMLIDDRLDLVLDIEPVLPADLRAGPERDKHHEGELSAAKRVVRRVKQTYGWIDVIVADALYANGPFLTLLQELRLGGVIIAKKETDEPLREAIQLWEHQGRDETIEDEAAKETIELWDCRDVETLSSYEGKVRMVRARVRKHREKTDHTWCMIVVGKATRLSALQVLRVGRGRWHIENTGFHQWSTLWKFTHVFTHDGNGILALYWLFFAAYNLLTLFLYRQLRSYGRDRGKDVTRTIRRLIEEMRDELARLDRLDRTLWDSS